MSFLERDSARSLSNWQDPGVLKCRNQELQRVYGGKMRASTPNHEQSRGLSHIYRFRRAGSQDLSADGVVLLPLGPRTECALARYGNAGKTTCGSVAVLP